ncbi:MAG: DinB family protein [Acidobacteria bacterium]|nr:DinB family protein [Acidobacteriota bacterium]
MADVVRSAIATVLHELFDGASESSGWLLNRKDPGLLRSLDRLSAADASAVPARGQSSIASHVDHIRYGLSLMNEASAGKNPFEDADWSAAWRTVKVSDEEWSRLRVALADEAAKWQKNFPSLVDGGEMALTGVVASAAHLAYHLGAIRQMNPAARGPKDGAST